MAAPRRAQRVAGWGRRGIGGWSVLWRIARRKRPMAPQAGCGISSRRGAWWDLRYPVPARARRGAEHQLGVAAQLDHPRLGLVGLADAVEARGVDRDDRVVDLDQQRVDPRQRRVVGELGVVAARVAAEQHAVVELVVADPDRAAVARADQLEGTGEVAALDEVGPARGVARAVRADDQALV